MPDWTQRLGDAFLANQQQVMDTVQMLRGRAQAAGNLQSTPQQTVIDQGGAIDIEPAQPQYVYVPVYDPTVIYGSWSDAYVPPYWYPPAVYGYPDLAPGFAAAIFFGRPFRVDYNHWGWARPNWRGHDIDVNVTHNYFANRPQYANRWRDGHWARSPEQHPSVAFRDNGAQGARPGNAVLQPHEPYRARGPVPMQQSIARPAQLQQPPITRVQPERPIARPVQQPQQGAWRAPLQSMYPVVHPAPQQQQAIARPLQQQPPRQRMTRVLPPLSQPSQSIAHSMPQAQRPIASPMAQPSARSAPQLAYNQQPHAQNQTNECEARRFTGFQRRGRREKSANPAKQVVADQRPKSRMKRNVA